MVVSVYDLSHLMSILDTCTEKPTVKHRFTTWTNDSLMFPSGYLCFPYVRIMSVSYFTNWHRFASMLTKRLHKILFVKWSFLLMLAIVVYFILTFPWPYLLLLVFLYLSFLCLVVSSCDTCHCVSLIFMKKIYQRSPHLPPTQIVTWFYKFGNGNCRVSFFTSSLSLSILICH